jgi:serine/threonine-protein kinase HipA
MNKSAEVYYKDLKAGVLRKTDEGFEFIYNDNYLHNKYSAPISAAMPLTKKRFFSAELFPFFENLLPEGFLLDLITSKLKIDKNDKFDLLLQIGGDTIGAVSILTLE